MEIATNVSNKITCPIKKIKNPAFIAKKPPTGIQQNKRNGQYDGICVIPFPSEAIESSLITA